MDIFTKIVRPTRNPMPSNAVSSPIFQTSAYAFEDIDEVDQILRGERPGYSYTRGGNPNSHALEQFISGIEETEDAVVTASGTASLLTGILGLCPKPCHIFLSREIYGGTVGICRRLLEPMGYTVEWVDTHDGASIRDALSLRARSSLLLTESISNPLGRVSPLDEIIEIAHSAGDLVIVDNTFATPYHARPAEWGADLVVHSLTKFIGGHSDLILGVVAGDSERIRAVRDIVDIAGFTPDPFAAWLALRGSRTLGLRMQAASQNAMELAKALESLSEVARVYYPGLPSHPDHDAAKRLLHRGFGAVVSMSLKGGFPAVQAMVSRLQLVRFVPSLGDVSTTLSHPVVASHRELTDEEKRAVDIDDSMVRISVGIEAVSDIIQDFRGALLS